MDSRKGAQGVALSAIERATLERSASRGRVLYGPVILTQVPNVALGEILCSRLRENGIEAYYRGANLGGGDAIGIADMNPLLPAEILVGAHHLEQARRLLDEP